MSAIVEICGVRYRKVGKAPMRGNTILTFIPGEGMVARPATRDDAMNPALQDDLIQELPRVPGWPTAMGPAPQYLWRDSDFEMVVQPDGTHKAVFPYGELREGDLVVSLACTGRWVVERLSAQTAAQCQDLTAWLDWDYIYGDGPKPPQGAWLIARADGGDAQ